MADLLERIRTYERQRRFWRLVDVRGRDECWRWLGTFGRDGTALYRGRPANLHAYELARGHLPAGSSLRRTCGHAACVNPEHMERVAATG
jgi:hypothetical protein